MTTPHVLIVLDGWGYREESQDNAIALGKTPTWDHIWENQPRSLISASGNDVGLPKGQMGNSEVGHMNLGTGRVVDQDLTRIDKALSDDSFKSNEVLLSLTDELCRSGKSLHIFGLLSPGGVHSHELHIKASIQQAFHQGVKSVYLHAFLDGRDVPPRSAEASLARAEQWIKESGYGGIASIMGRFYAMDRDERWDRIELAFYTLVGHSSSSNAINAQSALHSAYARGETDEFVKPTLINVDGRHIRMEDGDAVLFMNFRADRARQLSHCFQDANFKKFQRKSFVKLSQFVCLTKYSEANQGPVLFPPVKLRNGIGEYLSKIGKTQLRLAETEKYAHVTFFFSGGEEAPFALEERKLIPSPKVRTYDLEPSMSAPLVTEELIKAIVSKKYDLLVCNFANGDMVGHTGNLNAAIRAVECIDNCLSKIIPCVEKAKAHCLITADHGNVEKMNDAATGQAHTAHTSELVPLIYIGRKNLQLNSGSLKDIAPTILELMGITKPKEMTGRSLIERDNK